MLNRKLIYIIFASFIFSGELEVDGDLTVTGNIQSQTIDSLLQVIADLQSQLSGLQGAGNIKTKIIEIENYNLNSTSCYDDIVGGDYTADSWIDLSTYISNENSIIIFELIDLKNQSSDSGWHQILVYSQYLDDRFLNYPYAQIDYPNQVFKPSGSRYYIPYDAPKVCIDNGTGFGGGNGFVDLKLSITAQFPD